MFLPAKRRIKKVKNSGDILEQSTDSNNCTLSDATALPAQKSNKSSVIKTSNKITV
jgi:hypothetical protein